ncbi:hypothetical protein SDC9_128320 [bioreactor metagenome]|uniref:Secretion system C-terminal sorting domain-containing protein n=1 Tax=bioreactor metagenome TaxID=1076179 RepID=A0A645CWN4_9ZZZZ
MCPNNGKCVTFCCCDNWCQESTRPLIRDYYIAGRGVGVGIPYSSYSPSLDPAVSGGMYRLHVVSAKLAMPLNNQDYLNSNGWWIESTHGINNTISSDMPTALFTSRMNEVYNMRNVMWAAPFKEVAQYIYERDASTVEKISGDTSEINLKLRHSLSTSICDFTFPLTLKTEVYPEWKSVNISQDSNTVEINTVEEGGKTYIYYDAIPNAGQIKLSPSAYKTGTSLNEIKSSGIINLDAGFNVSTSEVRISYNMVYSGYTNLQIYNSMGSLVKTLVNNELSMCTYINYWDVTNIPAGLYFVKLVHRQKERNTLYVDKNSFVATKKLLINK